LKIFLLIESKTSTIEQERRKEVKKFRRLLKVKVRRL